MFVCCSRDCGDKGTEGVDTSTPQNDTALSPRPSEGQEDGLNCLFGERMPERAPASLLMVFRADGGEERALAFERTPFGLSFQPEMPIRVTKATGCAAELGVKPGWELLACGAVPLRSPNLRFEDALEVLRVQADLFECRRAEDRTASNVSITLRKPGGEVVFVSFAQAPLGIDFGRDVPLTVVAVSGNAANLGVQVGWEVKSVGGIDLDDPELLFAEAIELVKEEVCRLEGARHPMVEVGLPVCFVSGQTVMFDRAPLGFDLSPELPLRVTAVKGQAAKLRVSSGWVLQSVGGARLDDPGIVLADALALVRSKVARLEARRQRGLLLHGGLPLLFGRPEGGRVGLVFAKVPLGLDLLQSVPITVLSAQGQAAELGVEAGWELLAAGGVAVAASADFRSALAILEAMVERLQVQAEVVHSGSAAA